MNIGTIIACNLCGIVLLAMVLFSSRIHHMFGDIESRLFYSMIFVTMLGCLLEMVSFLVDGKVFWGARAINIVCNTYVYIANLLYPEMWLLFVEWKIYKNIERLKVALIYSSIPVVTVGIVLLFNIKFEFIFSVSSDNVYSRQPFCWIVLGFPYAYMVASVILAAFGNREKRFRFFPVWLFVVPVAIGSICQGIFYGISVVWCCLAISLVGIYISKQNEIAYIDSLSDIYNRKYMSYVLNKCQTRKNIMSGIMIDIDRFKNVNDTYGHQMGDKAITHTGQIILDSIPKDAYAIRYAGDEFIVLLNTQLIEEVVGVISKLKENLASYNETKPLGFPLDFSVGYSIYVPGENTMDQFLKDMDKDMYVEKRHKKLQGWSAGVRAI